MQMIHVRKYVLVELLPLELPTMLPPSAILSCFMHYFAFNSSQQTISMNVMASHVYLFLYTIFYSNIISRNLIVINEGILDHTQDIIPIFFKFSQL